MSQKKRKANRLFNPSNIYGKDKITPYSNKAKPLTKSFFNEVIETSKEIVFMSENNYLEVPEKGTVAPAPYLKAVDELEATDERKEEITSIIDIIDNSSKNKKDYTLTFENGEIKTKPTKKEQLTIEFNKMWTTTQLEGKIFKIAIEDERDYKERAKELKFMATRNTKYGGYNEALQFGSIEFSKNDLILLIKSWEEFFPNQVS